MFITKKKYKALEARVKQLEKDQNPYGGSDGQSLYYTMFLFGSQNDQKWTAKEIRERFDEIYDLLKVGRKTTAEKTKLVRQKK